MGGWFNAIACGAVMMGTGSWAGAQPASTGPDRAAIEQQVAAFVEAYNRGDMAAVAGFYTEDAMALPPGGDIVAGRAAIQAMWQAAQGAGVSAIQLNVLHVESSGAVASEVGRATLTVPGGLQHVKYLVVWKRDADGVWKLHRDIWNAATPPAPQG